MVDQVSPLCKSLYFETRCICHIRNELSLNVTATLVTLVLLKLGYGNGLSLDQLYKLPKYKLMRLK